MPAFNTRRLRAVLLVAALTIVVLGAVWSAVVLNLRSGAEVAETQRPSSVTPPESRPSSPPHAPAEPPGAVPVPAQPIVPAEPSPSVSIVEEPEPHRGLSPRCRTELEKLCDGIPLGGGRRKRCFEDNTSRLSPACRQQVEERTVKVNRAMQHFKVACEADIKQWCRLVESGGGRVLQCLKQHYKQVSDRCYQALVDLL